MNAADIINGSLRLLSVVDPRQSIDPTIMANSLAALNTMLDNFAARDLLKTAQTALLFPAIAGKSMYSIGPSGDWVSTAPESIKSATVIDSLNNIYPVKIISRDEFYSLPDRLLTSSRPDYLFYDNGLTQSGTQYVNLYPTPDSSTTYTVELQVEIPFTEFPNLTSSFTFPPSYARAFKYKLAIDLAPELGVTASPEIVAIARESYNTLVAANHKRQITSTDLGIPRSGNIYTF